MIGLIHLRLISQLTAITHFVRNLAFEASIGLTIGGLHESAGALWQLLFITIEATYFFI